MIQVTEYKQQEPLKWPKDFNAWYRTHGCDKEQLWLIQNMLGDLYPDSDNHKQAVEAWRNKSPDV